MLKIYSISLGCPKNRVDTERLLGTLGTVLLVDRPELADLALVNTCAFIEPAVRESVQVILEQVEALKGLSGRRPLLAVAGCLPGRYGRDSLAGDLPEVDIWLETRRMSSWPELINEAMSARGFRTDPSAVAGRLLSTGPSYAWLKICEGCGQSCAFCSIPMIRGAVRSDPEDLLADEAASLLVRGVREIILVAQDLTTWGRDLPGAPGLVRLLERLLELDGLARLRLMYLYPAGLSLDFLRFVRDAGPLLLPYFDVPLQHSHPEILRRMGRPFSQSPYKIVERIRSVLPEAALRTSLIVGFPGEGEEEFQSLCAFVRETRFHNLGVFSYYAEEGTEAARLPDQLPRRVKDFRRDRLMEMQAEISGEILQGYVGQSLEVLVDSAHPEWPGLWRGRAWFQTPEADGLVYLSGENLEPGQLVRAEVTESFTYDLNALV